jgi:hypothetical protein
VKRQMNVYETLSDIASDAVCLYSFPGGGMESEAHYPQWRRINQAIERPASLNESLIKLIEGDYSHFSCKFLVK